MIVTKLKAFRDLLNTCPCPAYHYVKQAAPAREYIIWQENGEGSSHYADDAKGEFTVVIDVEFYTHDEYSHTLQVLQDRMVNHCISYTYDGTQYEVDTGWIHHSFRVEV